MGRTRNLDTLRMHRLSRVFTFRYYPHLVGKRLGFLESLSLLLQFDQWMIGRLEMEIELGLPRRRDSDPRYQILKGKNRERKQHREPHQ